VSFISPADRQARIEGYAKAFGHEIARVEFDLDETGGKMDRPGFARVMARIRSGQTGGICVARFDRFARSNIDALNYAEEIESLVDDPRQRHESQQGVVGLQAP
jgi:site-specific DNA recombinase